MNKHISDYIKDGWIFHIDPATGKPEYGDGTSRLGLYWFPKIADKEMSAFFLYNYKKAFEEEEEPVRFPRSLDRELGWYSGLGFMSRDNLIPCVCCLLLLNDTDKLWRLYSKILDRLGFLWNTKKIGQKHDAWKLPDWVGLSTSALFLRAWVNDKKSDEFFFCYYLLALPFLLIADLSMLITSLVRLVGLYLDADNCGPDLNLIITHEAIKRSETETWISWLSRVVYYKFHPGAGPNNQSRMKGFGPLTSFKHYFAGNNNPPLDVHWEAYFNRKDL